jgi:hypothetical protein
VLSSVVSATFPIIPSAGRQPRPLTRRDPLAAGVMPE